MKPYVYIANELNLPCVISCNQLESVTNKAIMKNILKIMQYLQLITVLLKV